MIWAVSDACRVSSIIEWSSSTIPLIFTFFFFFLFVLVSFDYSYKECIWHEQERETNATGNILQQHHFPVLKFLIISKQKALKHVLENRKCLNCPCYSQKLCFVAKHIHSYVAEPKANSAEKEEGPDLLGGLELLCKYELPQNYLNWFDILA